MPHKERTCQESGPSELFAIARAAHLTSNRELKRRALKELRDGFGILVRFTIPRTGAPNAS